MNFELELAAGLVTGGGVVEEVDIDGMVVVRSVVEDDDTSENDTAEDGAIEDDILLADENIEDTGTVPVEKAFPEETKLLKVPTEEGADELGLGAVPVEKAVP